MRHRRRSSVRLFCQKCGREGDHRVFTRASGREAVYSSCRKCESSTSANTVANDQFRLERKVWSQIKERCLNPKCKVFRRYGGRGIRVCPRWVDSFEAFLEDMGRRPSSSFSIDRVDNDGDYTPENCRWATRRVQSRNRSDTVLLTHDGRTAVLADWASELGMNKQTLHARLKNGWSVAAALTTPVRSKGS